MTAAKVLLSLVALLVVQAGALAAEAAEGCCHCGCRKIKKVTRLIKTLKEIEVPAYQCSQAVTFYPDKRAVCRTGNRCDTFYKPHVHWHGRECRIRKESCEHVQHFVDKGHGKCDCSEEVHHKEHLQYQVHWTRHGCVSCETDSSCKTLYGASTCGCYDQNACVRKPTGEMCTRLAPEVRWVTYNVCHKCHHSWASDDAHVDELREPDSDVEPEADIEPEQPAVPEAGEARAARMLPRMVGRRDKAWGRVPRVSRR